MLNFLENVNRDTSNEKINGILISKNDFVDEMKHFRFLRENVPIDLDKCFTLCRYLVLLAAFVINFLLLFDSFVESCEECEGLQELGEDADPCVCG